MAGLNLLYKLLLKEAAKGSGKASGILSIGPDIRKITMNKYAKYVDSAKKQGVDLDKLSEQEIKYIIELNKPKGPMIGGHQVIDATSPEGQGITRDLFNMLDRQSGKNVIKTDFGGGVTDVVTETITKIKTMKPIDAMKEANSVLGKKGKYKRLTKEQTQKIIKDTEDHIFERDIKPDPEDFAHGGRTSTGLNYLLGEDDQNSRVPYAVGSTQSDFDQYLKDREQRDKEEQKRKFKKDFEDWKKWQDTQGGTMDWAAEGGRIGFGLGGGFNAARRAFLKLMGAGAAGTVAAKSGLLSIFKGGGKKQIVESLTQVPIGSAPGMPAWFKPLVNKVIKEGDDVTKKFATVDREIVHQVSLEGKIGKNTLGVDDVRVTQNLDEGTIRVQYNSPNTIGESGVELTYKKGEEIPIKKKGKDTSVKTKDEFTASEDDFYPQQTSPDGDFDLELTENIVKNVDDLYSDTSKLKEFATGKKLTIKEISESIKKKNILKEIDKNPNEHAFRNAPDYDPYPEPKRSR
jgi:hypothetical protein